jgi:hypothetical protein
MSAARAVRRPARTRAPKSLRSAFNPHEEGHAESLAVLSTIQERGDPVIAPTLLPPEIASAVARASEDSAGALEYANATAALHT